MSLNILGGGQSQQQTDESNARAIAAKINAGAPVSPTDVRWLYSKGYGGMVQGSSPYTGMKASPYTSMVGMSFVRPPSPTPPPARSPVAPAPQDFWTRQGYPEYRGAYAEPTVPTGWTVESVTRTSTGAPEVHLKLTNIGSALASGQTLPKEVMDAYQAGIQYDVDVAKSKRDWAQLGYAKYGGQYTAPDVPTGFKISGITEGESGLSIQYEPSNILGYMSLAKSGAVKAPNVLDYIKASNRPIILRAIESSVSGGVSAPKLGVLEAIKTANFASSERFWTGQGYPEYAGKYSALVIQPGFKIGKVTEDKAGLGIEYEPANVLGYMKLAKMGLIQKPSATSVSAEDYFEEMRLKGRPVVAYGSKESPLETPYLIDPTADMPVGLKGAYKEWLSSKIFWGGTDKESGHYFPEYAGKYAPLGAEAMAAIGEGWKIEKITEGSEGLAIAWKQPPKSVTQQISEFTVPSLNLRSFFTTPAQQNLEQKSPLFSEFTGATHKVKPLAPLEMFTVPVESAVLGGAHFIAKALGRDNPYFAAQPPISPFGALVGSAITMKPSVGELGSIEPYEVGFRGVGDLLTLGPTAELAVNLAKRGASKLSARIEVWRYGAEGSEKWMESIRAGTIVNPETGMTTYTGFAAKQASKLSPGIVSLPFGTTKSLSHILSGVSEETAMGAMDFSMDLTMTPHASAFSISKLANPAYVRPSLPIYQMIGGSLVNVSEMVTSWGDPNAKFKMFPETKAAIGRTSIQSDFEQLGFKDVITPKETPFTGFKDLPVGYSGSAPQHLYMKASNVVSEVKSMFADTRSAYRLELVLNKPSTSFMETSVQGISAGLSLPSARLVGAKATSFAYTGALLPLLGSYTATATEKEYVKAQNEMYGKGGYTAPSRITINTRLSSTFAFPTSTGEFPVIPDISMSRQSARLETKHVDMEEYLGLSTKLFQAQAGSHDIPTPQILMTPQVSRLKYRESTVQMPNIFEGLSEREDLMPFAIAGIAAVPISASVVGLKSISLTNQATMMKSSFASPFGYTPTDIFGTIPGIPAIFPKLPGSGLGGGGRSGYGKWFKMTRPILEPKQVWRQFWGMPKLSVSRIGKKGKRNKVTVTRVGSRKTRSKRSKKK